jgi:SOS-response transcriptional repressor LexA
MTEAQQAVYDFIAAYIETHGQSPTYGEIAVALQLTKLQVSGRIQALYRKGYVARNGQSFQRTLQLGSRRPGEPRYPGLVR